jgi:hypothetical protein
MGLNVGNYAGYGLMAIGGAAIIASMAPQSVLYTGAINSAQMMSAGIAAGGVGAALAAIEFK